MSIPAGFDLILAHFHSRLKMGLPLIGGDDEAALLESSSLGKSRAFGRIKQALRQGASPAESLAAAGKLPSFYIQVVRQAEKAGNLTRAFGLLLEHNRVLFSFQHHLRVINAYLLATLACLVIFLIFFGRWVWPSLAETTWGEGGPAGLPGRMLFSLAQSDAAAVILPLIILIPLVLALIKPRWSPVSLFLRNTPGLNKVYYRVVSLELGALYLQNTRLGAAPPEALNEAADGVGDARVSTLLRRAAQLAENGRDVPQALWSHPLLTRLPAVQAICLGEDSGRVAELLTEFNELLSGYLSEHLDREMSALFKGAVLICGLIVGLVVTQAFRAIWRSYGFIGGGF